MEYRYDKLLEKLNFLALLIRRRQTDALFYMSLVAPSVASLPSKQSALVFLLGTYVTLPCSVAPPATALQLGVFLLQMAFVNVQASLETQV
jgi:hypothetical protein